MEITETELEQQIFTLLTHVSNHLTKTKVSTTLRVAGGWVRDKILGLANDDIDIAIDSMTGEEFANHVITYVKNNEEYSTTEPPVLSSFAVVSSNPDQSKHLATAMLKVYGVLIDFVNLRVEEYDRDSVKARIPTLQKFGTPEQDAFRRDLTINALFYNLNTRSVEDFTGKGIADIKDGLIRTPVSPESTFLDDPLRILRAIRFSSRYNFTIVPEIYEACRTFEVKKRLFSHVTRERYVTEVISMLQGPNPLASIQLIVSLGLHQIVWAIPDTLIGDADFDFDDIRNGLPYDLDVLETAITIFKEKPPLELILAGLIKPLEPLPKPKKKKTKGTKDMYQHELPIVRALLTLKWPRDLANSVHKIHELESSLHTHNFFEMPFTKDHRLTLALALRKAGPMWRLGAIVAFSRIRVDTASVTRYQKFCSLVDEQKLDNCWVFRSTLLGNEVLDIIRETLNAPNLRQGLYLSHCITDLLHEHLKDPQFTREMATSFVSTWTSGFDWSSYDI